jgi:CelD/BcsL family acetyltransferase involved in cellulose biosynthesis
MLEIINEFEKFDLLKDEWAKLNTRNNPFQSHAFIKAWLKNYLPKGAELFILKNTAGIAPFYRQGKTVYWLGKGMGNYCDLLTAEDNKKSFWQEVLNTLKKEKISIYLHGLKNDSASLQILRNLGFKQAKETICPVIKITGEERPFAELLNEILPSKKRQYEIRKAGKDLAKAGELELVNFRNNIPDTTVQEILTLFKTRWQDQYGAEEAGKACFDNFQKEVMQSAEDVYISLLYLDKKLISFLFGFYQNNTFLDYMVAHNPAYRKYSIGNFHISRLLEELQQKELKIFDFSIGDEVYKRRWANDNFKVYDLYTSHSLKFNLQIWFLKLKEKLKGKYRAPLRNFLGKFKRKRSK